MGWKSKKDGTHYNDGKGTTRDVSGTPETEVNIEIDNNSDDFAEEIRKDFEMEEILKQQKIKAIEQQRENLRKQITQSSIVEKLIPNTVELSVSPIPGFVNLKNTWKLK